MKAFYQPPTLSIAATARRYTVLSIWTPAQRKLLILFLLETPTCGICSQLRLYVLQVQNCDSETEKTRWPHPRNVSSGCKQCTADLNIISSHFFVILKKWGIFRVPLMKSRYTLLCFLPSIVFFFRPLPISSMWPLLQFSLPGSLHVSSQSLLYQNPHFLLAQKWINGVRALRRMRSKRFAITILETKHLSLPVRVTYYADFFLEGLPHLMDLWEKGEEIMPTVVVMGMFREILSKAIFLKKKEILYLHTRTHVSACEFVCWCISNMI